MSLKTEHYYIQIASLYLELKIHDAELLQFIREEYSLVNHLKSLDRIEGLIEIIPYKNNLMYSFRAKHNKEKIDMNVSISNTIRIKEYILQSFIELSLFNKGIFFMHASCYYENADIFVFIGPSGSGKTTIVRLLKAKKVLSNDTTIFKYKDGQIDVFPSPFDKKSGIKMLSIGKRGKIHIFALSQSKIEKCSDLSPQEKINFIQKSMNFFLFIIHGEISPLHLLKQHNKKAYANILLLLRYALIYKLDFTLLLTSDKFLSTRNKF